MQDSGSLAVFKVTARDQGHYKGPSGAFVTYCNISCCSFFCSGFEPRQNQGRGLVDRKLVKALSSNFIAGRPKAALLFWFFGGFRCGVPLFIVILVIYEYQIGKNRC